MFKSAEGHYEDFACVWVPLCCCLPLVGDLHISNTWKVKRHGNGLYTRKSVNMDHRALLPLAARPGQPPRCGGPEIMPLCWLVWTYRARPVSSRINIIKESWPRRPQTTGLRVWGSEVREAQSLMSCVTLNNHSPLWALHFLVCKSELSILHGV